MKLKFKKNFRCYLDNELRVFKSGQVIDAPAPKEELGQVLARNEDLELVEAFDPEAKAKKPLEKLSVDELKNIASEMKVPGWHLCAKKKTLIEKIREKTEKK